MDTQTEFKTPSESRPSQAAIDMLTSYLLKRGRQWTTAKEITAALGLEERRIRVLAEHSACLIVSGPGCPGYRHLMNTTVEQIREIMDRLQSQGTRMIQRSIRIGKLAHKTIR
jgi:hypothetical protein